MRTNVDLDDELMSQAFRYTDVKTKKDLIHQALREFVERHRRRDLRELPGTVSLRPDYDYKSLRT